MQERRIWISILILGIVFQILAAIFMPLGLDAHVHATYVSDGIADDDPTLDWGKLRIDGANQSIAEEIPAEEKWFIWHGILEIWLDIFGISLFSLHILSLIISFSSLAVVYFSTKSLWGEKNALALTAILSIYSPLVRSTGRLYQESIVLMLATIIIFAVIRIIRRENHKFWHITCLICLALILSIKGLPVKYSLYLYMPILSLELHKPKYKPVSIPILIIITTLISIVLVWHRLGEVTLDLAFILPVTIFISGIIYLYIGGLLFASNSTRANSESDLLMLISQLIFAGLCGYIVMLLLVEMNTLETTRETVQNRFRYIYRYVTVLVVPLWWSQMAKDENSEIQLKENKQRSLMTLAIALMLIINGYLLTFDRGLEKVGEDISEEIEDNQNILYIADPPLSMHRLYTLQLTIDPHHDRNITAFWVNEDINWTELIEQNSIDWVIFSDNSTNYLDENWVSYEIDADYEVFYLPSQMD
tara:strand:- start:3854 stop:5281 length:1428 start_codon:yes stop_codon:yes gene_type:complete